jgi:hypothetical protein
MIWKDAIVTYFKALSRRLSGGTEENDKEICQDSQNSG